MALRLRDTLQYEKREEDTTPCFTAARMVVINITITVSNSFVSSICNRLHKFYLFIHPCRRLHLEHVIDTYIKVTHEKKIENVR